MPRPPLTDQQTALALEAYQTVREQAVRYVLSILDPTAVAATALPYPEVLRRVYALIGAEWLRYREPAAAPLEPVTLPTDAQEEAGA